MNASKMKMNLLIYNISLYLYWNMVTILFTEGKEYSPPHKKGALGMTFNYIW